MDAICNRPATMTERHQLAALARGNQLTVAGARVGWLWRSGQRISEYCRIRDLVSAEFAVSFIYGVIQ